MRIDFSEARKFKFTMVDYYIKEMLEELPKDMNGTSPTPETSHLLV